MRPSRDLNIALRLVLRLRLGYRILGFCLLLHLWLIERLLGIHPACLLIDMVTSVDLVPNLGKPDLYLLNAPWLRLPEMSQHEDCPALDATQVVHLCNSTCVLVNLLVWPLADRHLIVLLLDVDEASCLNTWSHGIHCVEWMLRKVSDA